MSVIDEVYFNGSKVDEVYVNNLEVISTYVDSLGGTYFPLRNTSIDPVGSQFSGSYTFVPNDGLYFDIAPTDFSLLFFDASGVYNSRIYDSDVGLWDMSRITNAYGMFLYTDNFNKDISKWDTSSLLDMSFIFYYSNFNHNITNWDTSNVINMNFAFYNSKFNQDISILDVGNVLNMDYMFGPSDTFTQDLSSWCVTNITEEPPGFAGGNCIQPIWGTCPNG